MVFAAGVWLCATLHRSDVHVPVFFSAFGCFVVPGLGKLPTLVLQGIHVFVWGLSIHLG
jgi:hypothetical protein